MNVVPCPMPFDISKQLFFLTFPSLLPLDLLTGVEDEEYETMVE